MSGGAFAAGLAFAAAASAQTPAVPDPGGEFEHVGAALQIEPKRVSLTPERPSARITLRLPEGQGPAEFDVSLVDRIMLPDGRIVAVAESGDEKGAAEVAARLRSAQPYVAFTPAAVILRPDGRAFDIDVTLKTPPPAPGEYRTHLTITARDLRAAERPKGGPAVMTWAHALPLIVRAGPADVRGAIQNARVETLQGGPGVLLRPRALTFDLVRLGTNSLFGDITLEDAEGRTATIARNAAVYAELERRRFVFPLSPSITGVVEIRFTDRDSEPGHVLATARVDLSPVRSAQVSGAGR